MKQARLNLPPASGFSCSDDGRLLAGIGRRVIVVDLAARRRLSSSLPFSHPCHTSFSPDGSKLAVKSTSGRIAIIDPVSGEIAHDFENDSDGEGCAVRFSPDGRELVDGSWCGDLIVRSTSGHAGKRLSFPDGLITDVVHDLSRTVWLVLHQPRVVGDADELPPSYVTIWHWPFSGAPVRRINLKSVVDAICLSPDGNLMAFVEGFEESRAHIARVADGQIIASSELIGRRFLGSKLAWKQRRQLHRCDDQGRPISGDRCRSARCKQSVGSGEITLQPVRARLAVSPGQQVACLRRCQ
ncbi:MAG: WD40 repeat domain-containing protein [Mesorhizobium sp.]|nr:WD40 repeat domain-containing protein [Mesorhizobium sp.]MBL8576290.1 WD40 repeat domain-containing protein [Mesorhizobium sp.]